MSWASFSNQQMLTRVVSYIVPVSLNRDDSSSFIEQSHTSAVKPLSVIVAPVPCRPSQPRHGSWCGQVTPSPISIVVRLTLEIRTRHPSATPLYSQAVKFSRQEHDRPIPRNNTLIDVHRNPYKPPITSHEIVHFVLSMQDGGKPCWYCDVLHRIQKIDDRGLSAETQ